MKYLSTKEISKKWNVSERMVRIYCTEGRVPNAIQEKGLWMIPEGTKKPKREVPQEPELTKFAKRVVYQRSKNNHFGIYEYIQVNLAYSSNRMASNRLTRTQVEEIYRTNKVATAFEPVKVDDIIETINHFSCVQYVVDNITTPLTQSFIKKLHYLLTYGTYSDRKHKAGSGEYRTGPGKIGVPPREINRALSELINEYEKQPADFEQILNFHVRFECIRPFEDYNGRVGRVIVVKECLRYGVDPFIVDDKRRGDYYLPCATAPATDELGVWERLRLRHLREHQNGIYTGMLLSGKLEAHLAEVNARAEEMFERLVDEMSEDEGITEELKAVDQMAWVQQMNSIRSRAAEIVREELIYA